MIDRTQQAWIERAANTQVRHRLYFHTLGTLVPLSIPLEKVRSVLDVFCGPGAWAIDLAKARPDIQITAIDLNSHILQIARTDAMLAGVTNITFDANSPMQALPYDAETFDLVHVQSPLLRPVHTQWPAILQHLLRVLRSGYWLYLNDLELGPTSSPAFERFINLVREALLHIGKSTSQDGAALTSAVFYPRLLAEAGCHDVHYTLTPIDLGNQPGSIGHDHPLSDLATNTQAGDLLIATGYITQAELDDLFQRIHYETQQANYCAVAMLISTIGTKP